MHEVFASLCGHTAYDRDRGTVFAFLTMMTRSRGIDRLRRRVRSARLLETWRENGAAPARSADAPPLGTVKGLSRRALTALGRALGGPGDDSSARARAARRIASPLETGRRPAAPSLGGGLSG
jgi:DNA-directed RNA polymerase specialized sigma24 family protein